MFIELLDTGQFDQVSITKQVCMLNHVMHTLGKLIQIVVHWLDECAYRSVTMI